MHDHHDLARQRFRVDADAEYIGQKFLVIAVHGGHQLPHPYARYKFAHQHLFAAILKKYTWRRDILLAFSSAPPKQVGVAGLRAEIHLIEQDGLEFFPEISRDPGGNDSKCLSYDQKPIQRAQVGRDEGPDPRPPDLHRHACAGFQASLVDARQRSGPDRFWIKNLEHISEWLSETSLDDCNRLLRWKRRSLVEHSAQLGAISIGQHIGTNGHLLCQLGECRAAALECTAQPDSAAFHARAAHQDINKVAEIEPDEASEPHKNPADRQHDPGLEAHAARTG